MRREAIQRLLPGVYQTALKPGSPLIALLDAMDQFHAPAEAVLERLDEYLDPYLAPPNMVPFLSRWVDLDWVLADAAEGGPQQRFAAGLGRLRNLIALAPQLSARRGTAEGLLLFLETATGVSGFQVDDATDPGFHVTVSVPEAAAHLAPLIERIVRVERPAHATYDIVYPRTAGPDEEPAPQDEDGRA
ncbi:MAG: phage tail protein [Actinobacteria bacterium]|nr:phage tail protein [Actinomycetota bacterium]